MFCGWESSVSLAHGVTGYHCEGGSVPLHRYRLSPGCCGEVSLWGWFVSPALWSDRVSLWSCGSLISLHMGLQGVTVGLGRLYPCIPRVLWGVAVGLGRVIPHAVAWCHRGAGEIGPSALRSDREGLG